MTSHPSLQGTEGFPGCGDFCLKSRTGVELVTRLTTWSHVLPGGFLQQLRLQGGTRAVQLASSEILIQSLWEWWEASASLTRRGPLPGLCSHIGGFPDGERNGQCPGTLAGRGKEVPTCPSQGVHIYIYKYTHTPHTAPPLLQGAEKLPQPQSFPGFPGLIPAS